MCKNTLADFELIPEFYKWYCDAYPSENVTSRKQITSHRRLFVFQMLLLYSPESLQAKKRMPPGLREKLSSVYTEIKPCVISNDISVVVSDYKFYQDFKDQVQLIYGELMKRWVIHLKDQAENN